MNANDLAMPYCEVIQYAELKAQQFCFDKTDVIGLLELELCGFLKRLAEKDKSSITQRDLYNKLLPELRSIILRAEKIMKLPEFSMPLDCPKKKDGAAANHKDAGGEA